MNEHDWLAERFEENRTHLRTVAYRMLGSLSEADDAVQEAWLRLSRSDASEVQNLGGWFFEEIAPIVGRSEAAARQLASRARRRVRGMSSAPDADATRRREAVAAFLAAS